MSTTRRFQFKIVNTLVMVFGVVLCLYLAYWQSGRIVEKQNLENKYQQMLEAAPLNLNSLDNKGFTELGQRVWQKVNVRGKFLEQHAFFLDSQVYQGKPGYHYIVPLAIEALGNDQPQTDRVQRVILVNLGWIASGNRQDIPDFPAITTPQPIEGHLASPKTAMPGFEAQDINAKVQLFINLEALSDKIARSIGSGSNNPAQDNKTANIHLAPMMLLLDENAQGSLPRAWPKYQAKIEMHEFYVLHWLLVALAIVLLYFYFAYKTPRSDKTLHTPKEDQSRNSEE